MLAYPDVDVRLREGNSENIQQMVLSGEADLGICSAFETDPRLQLEPLMENPFGFVCPPGHRMAGRRRLAWSDLDGIPLIATTAHRQLKDPRALQVLSGAKLRAEGVLTLLALVRQEIGVTVLPEIAVPRNDPALTFVALTEPRLNRQVHAMRLRDRTPDPAAAIMLEHLLAAVSVLPRSRRSGGTRRPAASA
jgi:DNA-binding transcriptional LysR family regulator